MARWQRTLDLKDVWESKDLSLIARTIAQRLTEIEPLENEHSETLRQELIENFSDLADEPAPDVDDFDDLMDKLYDWADTRLDNKPLGGKRVCWVATSF